MADTLEELAARCESASADQQHDLLTEAFHEIHGESAVATDWGSSYVAKRFAAMLRAEAYESAAMMLVSEGCCVAGLGDVPDNSPARWWCNMWLEDRDAAEPEVNAATLALALTAAALKAIAKERG